MSVFIGTSIRIVYRLPSPTKCHITIPVILVDCINILFILPTSHDSPDWADEIEDLGFDSWVIPKASNSLVNTPADWWQKEKSQEVEEGCGNKKWRGGKEKADRR